MRYTLSPFQRSVFCTSLFLEGVLFHISIDKSVAHGCNDTPDNFKIFLNRVEIIIVIICYTANNIINIINCQTNCAVSNCK